MNPILNHWYEFKQMPVMQYTGGVWPTEEPLRDLTIGPENLITAGDVGRWALCRSGETTAIKGTRGGLAELTRSVRTTVHVVDDCYKSGHMSCAYRTPGDLTRWLSARECAERKLNATHPTQIASARAPGEFRVGDLVRWDWEKYTDTGAIVSHGEWRLADGHEMCSGELPVRWKDGSYASAKPEHLTLIEPSLPSQPAREGEDASTRKGDGASPGSNQGELSLASSPPAPSHGDQLMEFFRDRRPAAQPWIVGARVEPVVRREMCRACKADPGFLLRHSRFCPECAGRGWQEVR